MGHPYQGSLHGRTLGCDENVIGAQPVSFISIIYMQLPCKDKQVTFRGKIFKRLLKLNDKMPIFPLHLDFIHKSRRIKIQLLVQFFSEMSHVAGWMMEELRLDFDQHGLGNILRI